jgi:peptide/nickel transport system permease protein
MTAYIVRRLLHALIVIIIVSILIFLLMRFLPGDPLQLYIANQELYLLPESKLNELRHQFGLDKSLVLQYFDWISGITRGDFGKSFLFNTKVNTLLVERLPVTIHLALLAVILSSTCGILAGTICAIKRGGAVDVLVTSAANLGVSIPVFWLGILLMYLFGYSLNWLPIHGYTSPFQNFWLNTRQLVMPVICLSVVAMASKTRQMRSSMLEVVHQDYIRTAWSKGLRERTVILRHVLKNSLIPVITLIGLQVAHIFGGSVLIETVFNIPGMGRLMVDGVLGQDYIIVQSGCLIISMMVVLINLLVDISYIWFDPRVKYD